MASAHLLSVNLGPADRTLEFKELPSACGRVIFSFLLSGIPEILLSKNISNLFTHASS